MIGGELRRQAEIVGVFVNAPMDEVASLADRCRLTMLQFHGDEGPAYCREAARRTGAKIIKAARVHDAAQVRDLQPFHTDFHLLDTHSMVAPGGTGGDLRLAAGQAPRRHAAAGAERRAERGQRGGGHRRGAAVRGGLGQRHRGRARP